MNAKEFAAGLRALADHFEGLPLGGTITIPNMQPFELKEMILGSGSILPQSVILDGVFSKDYWETGFIGAQKGTIGNLYSQAQVMLGIVGGDRPRHTFVMSNKNTTLWNEAIMSAADIGWRNGKDYHPIAGDPPEETYTRWIEAGAPTRNAYGGFDSRGQIIDPNQWADALGRLRL